MRVATRRSSAADSPDIAFLLLRPRAAYYVVFSRAQFVLTFALRILSSWLQCQSSFAGMRGIRKIQSYRSHNARVNVSP
jgi:hypothetical protein